MLTVYMRKFSVLWVGASQILLTLQFPRLECFCRLKDTRNKKSSDKLSLGLVERKIDWKHLKWKHWDRFCEYRMHGKEGKFVGLGAGRYQQKFTSKREKQLRYFGHVMQVEDKSLERSTMGIGKEEDRKQRAWTTSLHGRDWSLVRQSGKWTTKKGKGTYGIALYG